MKLVRMWIGGAPAEAQGGAVRKLVNPATGEPLVHVPEAAAADAKKAVAAARRAVDEGTWAKTSPGDRSVVLTKLASLLRRSAADLSRLDSQNMGKPIVEAEIDAELAARCFERCGRLASDLAPESSSASESELSLLVREPVGLVAQLLPWTSPLLMAASTLAPALASGCASVLKPADETPLSTIELARFAAKAGVPAGIVNVLTGGVEACREALLADRYVDQLIVAGRRGARAQSARGGAEAVVDESNGIGMKSATLVLEDADPARAVEGVLRAAFGNQGQARSAASRLIVHESIYSQFVEALTAAARRIRLGDPLDRETRMGPLVSAERRDQVLSWIKLGRKEGARLVSGGGPPKNGGTAKGFYVEPTVFVDVDRRMRIAREEIGGPVLCVLRFRTEDEAVSTFNEARAARAGAVWTPDIRRGIRVLARLRAPFLWLNDYRQSEDEIEWDSCPGAPESRQSALEKYLAVKRIHVRLDSWPPP